MPLYQFTVFKYTFLLLSEGIYLYRQKNQITMSETYDQQ